MTTALDVVGQECLSFTVSGPFAHFRRVDSTTEKPTYRVIPRTTVAGLLAAVLGEPRDSYYETFSREHSAMAISPVCSLRTQSIPMLTLPTTSGDIKSAQGVSGKTVIDPETIAKERKRRTFEYVVDAAYRIDLILAETDTFERLAEYLTSGRAVYTPSLGKTECLASFEDVERNTVEAGGDPEAISSTVPEGHVVPTPDTPLRMERSPAFMEAEESGRKTTGFASYAYAPETEPLHAPEAPLSTVGDRTVCFR
ncbi:type I-B CRISPR-associated protein Cas5 [Halobacteriales archaeon SW_8_65_20]|nr:MAG: type I-B CRISPR-associated protein Cas5 [Halobacteriales archaeon QH_7_65_31]PSQ52574.1 MAG: type I-B CRISPR-associated protein Cas5 [Halobacteriales archaeon SW_8_65_20]